MSIKKQNMRRHLQQPLANGTGVAAMMLQVALSLRRKSNLSTLESLV